MDLLEICTVIKVIFLNVFCAKMYLALYTFHKLNSHLLMLAIISITSIISCPKPQLPMLSSAKQAI